MDIRKVTLLCLFIIICLPVIKAQEEDSSKVVPLDTSTVTVKSVFRKILEQPYTVTSVSTTDLKNKVADAKSILDKVPGIRVMQTGGMGSDFNLTLNGFSGQNVKIFLDGIPIDQYGSSFNLNNISVNSIERIDIYKGVVPVELGADALGGVINIITNKKKNSLDVSYSFGSFNTHRASVNGSIYKPESGWVFRGSANYNYSKNNYKVYVPIVRNNMIESYENVRRFHDRYYSGNIQLETGVMFKKYADQLLFGVIASADDQQVQHGNTMSTVYGGIVRNSKNIAGSVKYIKKDIFTDGLDLSSYISYNAQRSNIIDSLQGVTYNWLGETVVDTGSNRGELSRNYSTYNNKELNLGVNIGYRISVNHSLSANYQFINYHRNVYDQFNPNKIENNFPKALSKGVVGLGYNATFFKIWKTTFFGKFYSLQAKGDKLVDFALPTQRTDVFKSNKTNFGYGVASTIFPLEGLQLKVSYESSVRMPLPDEIFGDGLFTTANIDLKPERSNNVNFTFLYDLPVWKKNKLSFGSSFIFRNAKDLIYRIATIASPITSYGNIGDARTYGIEGNVGYKWNNIFHVTANITYQNITDQSDFIYVNSTTNGGRQTNYQKGFRIPNIPFLFGNTTVGFNFKNVGLKESTLGVNYIFNYVDEYFLTWSELGDKNTKKVIPRQTSHDIEVVYTVKNGKYNISLECLNVGNQRLYDKFYLQKPGRSFFVKLRYTL